MTCLLFSRGKRYLLFIRICKALTTCMTILFRNNMVLVHSLTQSAEVEANKTEAAFLVMNTISKETPKLFASQRWKNLGTKTNLFSLLYKTLCSSPFYNINVTLWMEVLKTYFVLVIVKRVALKQSAWVAIPKLVTQSSIWSVQRLLVDARFTLSGDSPPYITSLFWLLIQIAAWLTYRLI